MKYVYNTLIIIYRLTKSQLCQQEHVLTSVFKYTK